MKREIIVSYESFQIEGVVTDTSAEPEGELKPGRVGGAPRRVPGQISPVAIYILSR